MLEYYHTLDNETISKKEEYQVFLMLQIYNSCSNVRFIFSRKGNF